MDNYTAVAIAEGFEEAGSEEQVIEAWQHLIDTGLAWTLQGWFGRTATRLIEQGICQPKINCSQYTNGKCVLDGEICERDISCADQK